MRKQRPAEKRIRVEERPTKKLREKFEGIGRWKDRDRRAGGIEEKKGDRWVESRMYHGDFTSRKAVQVVVRLEAGQMHLAF